MEMMNNKVCKVCDNILPIHHFYYNKGGDGKYRYSARCKSCLGIKNPDKVVRQHTKAEKQPTKKEINRFIDEMKKKSSYFDFVDSLRLIDIFTRQFGIVFTSLPVEQELLYMWESIKKVNGKK